MRVVFVLPNPTQVEEYLCITPTKDGWRIKARLELLPNNWSSYFYSEAHPLHHLFHCPIKYQLSLWIRRWKPYTQLHKTYTYIRRMTQEPFTSEWMWQSFFAWEIATFSMSESETKDETTTGTTENPKPPLFASYMNFTTGHTHSLVMSVSEWMKETSYTFLIIIQTLKGWIRILCTKRTSASTRTNLMLWYMPGWACVLCGSANVS